MLTNVKNTNVNKCWKMLTNVNKFYQIQMLTNTNVHKWYQIQMLTNVNKYKSSQILTNHNKC